MKLTTTAPDAHPFNPAQWLADFGEHGGGYYACPDSVRIGWLVTDGAINTRAAQMLRSLSAEQEQAVKDHILSLRDLTPDPIEDAWQRIRQARAAYACARGDDEEAEAQFWAVVDPAETEIMQTEGKTLRHAEIKLWAGICHSVTHHSEEEAARNEDLAALLAAEHAMDFNLRCLLSALATIKSMGAR